MQWKILQTALCEALGWRVFTGMANFFLYRTDVDVCALRLHGIKLRDCTSMGLPDHVRISIQSKAAIAGLQDACQRLKGTT